jgi:hypothetical protein
MADHLQDMMAQWRKAADGYLAALGDGDGEAMPFELEDEAAERAFEAMQAAFVGSAAAIGEATGAFAAAVGNMPGVAQFAHAATRSDVREVEQRVDEINARLDGLEAAIRSFIEHQQSGTARAPFDVSSVVPEPSPRKQKKARRGKKKAARDKGAPG